MAGLYDDLAPDTDDPYADLEPEIDEPQTKTEAAAKNLSALSIPGQIGEGIVSLAGNMGTMAMAGLSGLNAASDTAFDSRDSFETGRPTSRPSSGADIVEGVQQAGAEVFAPESPVGQAVVEGAVKGTEMAGTAIKYPLSAVPFAVAALAPGGKTGSEERQEFMEMPMSRYLGELAQDSGASPFWAMAAHMAPDAALTALGAKGYKAGKTSKPQQAKPPTIEELKAQANALYDVVDNAGIRISDQAFSAAVDSIRANVRASGARPSLSPKTWKALDELAEDAKAGNITLKQAEELRRVLKKAQSGVDADKGSATRALREYDKFLENLKPNQLSGAAGKETVEFLKSARALWARARKTEQIEDMIDTAGLNAGQYTGSGFENALRLQFRQLARNKKKMKMFTAAEQKAVRSVAFGTATGNVMRQIGKFAPTGVVSLGIGSGAGFMVGGPAGAALVPAVGSLARWAATRSTVKGAQKAAETMRRGP